MKKYILGWLERLFALPEDPFDLQDDTNDIIEE